MIRKTLNECAGLEINIGIITVRPDEFAAVTQRFGPTLEINGNQLRYVISEIVASNGATGRVAIARCIDEGTNRAQQVAANFLSELKPKWLLLTGIGGGLPDSDYTLGDVLLATRAIDYSVGAYKEGKPREFDIRGYPVHAEVSKLLQTLPELERTELGLWSQSIGVPVPEVNVPLSIKSKRLYGPQSWRRKVLQSLTHHFGSAAALRARRMLPVPMGTSNDLLKDGSLAQALGTFVRKMAGTEMELGGVLLAAQGSDVPVLAIRGVSDIVGYERHAAWTNFACESVAACTHAIIMSGYLLDSPPFCC